MTDEFNCYARLPRVGYTHETGCHSAGEYARDDVHTNIVEGFFAIVKRGLYGKFHAVSRKPLHRYLGEFEFRYNTRWYDNGHGAGDSGGGRSAAHLPAAGKARWREGAVTRKSAGMCWASIQDQGQG